MCIASFNRKPEVLRKTLQSIFVQTPPFDWEVILVDDGSEYGACDVWKEFPVRYHRIEREPVVRCPGTARNMSYRLATGEILIPQSDEVVHQEPDTIEALVGLQEAHPEHFIIGTVLGLDERGEPQEVYTGRWNGHRRHKPLFFLGAVWRQDVYAIGGNDEDFTRSGGNAHEDKWFADCLIKGQGLTPMYTPEVRGHHLWHPRRITNKQVRKNGRLYERKVAEAQETGVWCASDGPWHE